jgi:hypothetical protein
MFLETSKADPMLKDQNNLIEVKKDAANFRKEIFFSSACNHLLAFMIFRYANFEFQKL